MPRTSHNAGSFAIALTLTIGLAGCGGEDPVSPPPPPPPPPVVVAVTPATASVPAGGTQTLTASVANATNPAVTWAASGGQVSGTGATVTWTAPATGGGYTVTATSVADPTKSGSASLAVTPAMVVISPATVSLFRGQPQAFTATVSGVVVGGEGVTWSSSCGVGAPTGGALAYTAPDAAGTCTITATSTLDPTTSGTATVTVRPDWLVGTTDDTNDGACTWTHCSLREAIVAAQATPALDTILLGTTALAPVTGSAPLANAPVTGVITLSNPLPFITTPMAIIGPGANELTIDANGSAGAPRRVLEFNGEILGGVVGLTLRGGYATGGGGVSISGGADITFTGVIITDNESSAGGGGGLSIVGASTARLENTMVVNNLAAGLNAAGGGIDVVQNSTLLMNNGSVSNNMVPDGWGGAFRLFDGTVHVTGVSIDGNSAGLAAGGGAVMAEGIGTVTMQGGSVSGNSTVGNGGGLWVRGEIDVILDGVAVNGNEAEASAGGILLQGDATLAMTNGTVSNNIAAIECGAVCVLESGEAAFTNATIAANQANAGGGFVVGNEGHLTLEGTTVSGNISESRAGGLFLWGMSQTTLNAATISDNIAKGGLGFGGGAGIYAQNTATLTSTNSVIAGNDAQVLAPGGGVTMFAGTTASFTGGEIRNNRTGDGAGGGLWGIDMNLTMVAVTISGNSAMVQGGGLQLIGASMATLTGLTVRGNEVTGTGGINGGAGGIGIFGTTTATIATSTITENEVTSFGGGLAFGGGASVSVTASEVSDNNSGGVGGGLSKSGGAVVTIETSRFTGNTAETQGGGMQLVGTGAVNMDRIIVRDNHATTASGGGITFGTPGSLTNSTVSGNTTPGIGGGIFSSSTGTPLIRNVTLSGNTALSGGALGITGSPTLRNVTVTANTATEFGGGIYSNNAGAPALTSVLVSGNLVGGAAQNCATGGTAVITSMGNNLSDDASCASFSLGSDKVSTAAGLNATLADNGGPTLTHALLAGSPAIDAGQAAGCPTTDQRGFGRVGVCDIGAFEFGGTAPAPGPALQSRAIRAPVVSPRFRLSGNAQSPRASPPGRVPGAGDPSGAGRIQH